MAGDKNRRTEPTEQQCFSSAENPGFRLKEVGMTERRWHIDLSERAASSALLSLSLCPKRSMALKLGCTLKSPRELF